MSVLDLSVVTILWLTNRSQVIQVEVQKFHSRLREVASLDEIIQLHDK